MATEDASKPTITLYTSQTPNGIKISITLEELGLPYNVYKIDGRNMEQKQPWFLAINPNGRIPALTDTLSGSPISLFESGSIMQYLVETYDRDNHLISYPPGTKEHFETNNWLFFLNAGVGPMQGQANHFVRYAGEQIPYAIKRYQDELRRLYSVLETHLKTTGRPYLVGEKCTIADIAHWGWICLSAWAGVELDEFPMLVEWEDRMAKRPGVEKGRHVPEPHTHKELLKDKAKMKEMEERGKAFAAKSAEHTADQKT